MSSPVPLDADLELVRFKIAFGDRGSTWGLDHRLLLADLRRQRNDER